MCPHSFIAGEQASFYALPKATLKTGEFLAIVDFSENYSFALQDAAQGLHWNNSQATLHPFVVYYIDSGEVCHVNYVVISDCLNHDTVTVYLFQISFTAFLKELLTARLHPRNIIYLCSIAVQKQEKIPEFVPPQR